jgi:hypothetical protein
MKSLAALLLLPLLAPARGFAQEVPPPMVAAPAPDEDDIDPPPMVAVPVPLVPVAPPPQLLPQLDGEHPPVRKAKGLEISPERRRYGKTIVLLAHLVQFIGVSMMVPGVFHLQGTNLFGQQTWSFAPTLIGLGAAVTAAGNGVEAWGWTILGRKERAPVMRVSVAASGAEITF